MKIRPLGNRLLVRRSKMKASKGGILLPDTAKEKPKEGEVLAIGPGKMNENGEVTPVAVHVGDRVLFSSYAGMEVKGDANEEDELLILSEDEVLGILGEKK
jgi:chaperonin GroES